MIRSGGATTLQDLLQQQAVLHPSRPALTFLSDGETESETMTYAQLDERARALAGRLLGRSRPGTRACLFYPPGIDYIVALVACLYAGVIAVPGYPPRSRRRLQRLESLIEDPAGLVALTNASTWSLIAPALDLAPETFRTLRWIVTDENIHEAGVDVAVTTAASDDIAIIQYTSGSGSAPRGVRLSHRNLLHNIACMREHFQVTSDTRCVTWLPPYHDMGLIGSLLTALTSGAWTIQMSPAAFMQRPARWLEAITKYGGTISGGPNSAYELCVHRISAADRDALDLRSWDVAFNGAEAVRPDTLTRFEAAFGARGFRRASWLPCYGLAEATLLVAGRPRQTGPTAVTVAGSTLAVCGSVIADTTVRIVDPDTLQEVADGNVGEIWVAGPAVADGYWSRDEETRAAFGARLPGDDREYLRTGDLGCSVAGELVVTSRLKDLIILNGANHNPHEIEAVAQAAHAALRPASGAAFTVDGDGGERLVIVHEVEPRASVDAGAVCAAIRHAVADERGVETSAIVLVKAGTIPRTSSGKIRRRDTRAAFLASTLEVVGQWQSRTEHDLREWLTTTIAERLSLPRSEVQGSRPFVEFGLDSADAVSLVLDLEAWLGRPVSPTVIWDYPAIDQLARHLAGAVVTPAVAPAARPDRDAVAIVGMACRLPGAPDTAAFWDLLRDGRSGISEVPAGRWDFSRWRPGGQETPETNAARWGGFLSDVDQFDPYFFGIVPREATAMDPQQRLLMEVTWEALEHAGIPPSSLSGTRTGVFVGISNLDYARGRDTELDIYTGTGNALSIASNRLSYFFDLKGPSLAVDTACSSSLTAVHLACQSLLRGESDAALAGGVNLLLSPEASLVFAQARMLAPDGICRVFDAGAHGYVRGEGAGIVVLKRLADAQRDGDRIDAVILATSVNQDGRTNGLTAPNGPSQRAALAEALRVAGVAPRDVGYVEAHGTGTPLGDPIEMQSVAGVLGAADTPTCWVGSLKANIGHLEPAAGVASLIKTVLALGHEEIPPQINVRSLNPHLGLEGTRIDVPLAPQPWRRDARPRVGVVSAFGFGGTNACAVLAEGPIALPHVAPGPPAPQLFTMSARTPAALRVLAARYAAWLATSDADVADVCFTANTGRAQLPVRWATIISSRSELREALLAVGRGETPTAAAADPVLESLRTRFLHGDALDWSSLYGADRRARLALPTYPFERERFWISNTPSPLPAAPMSDEDVEEEQSRPLLGRRLPIAVATYESTIPGEALAYLRDHGLHGQTVFPAAGYVEMALEAALEELGAGNLELTDVTFSRAMLMPVDGRRCTQIALTPAGRNTAFTVYSRPADAAGAWIAHATGTVRTDAVAAPTTGIDNPDLVRGRCTQPVDVAAWYDQVRQAGLEYGAGFRAVRQAWRGTHEAIGRVELEPTLAAVAGDYAVHPAFLDACFHVLGIAGDAAEGLFLPVSLEAVRVRGISLGSGWVHAWRDDSAPLARLSGGFRVFDATGTVVLEVDGLTFQQVDSRRAAPASTFSETDLQVTWEAAGTSRDSRLAGHWAVVTAAADARLVETLAAAGASSCTAVQADHLRTVTATTTLSGVVVDAGSFGDDAAAGCGAALLAVQTLLQCAQRPVPRLFLLTRGARIVGDERGRAVERQHLAQGAVWGFGAVAAIEAPALQCVRIDIDGTLESYAALPPILAAAPTERQLAVRRGHPFVARLAPYEAAASDAWALATTTPGALEGLRRMAVPRREPGPREIEIEVAAAALNFSDVMKAMGLYPGAAPILGAECAGVVTRVGSAVTEWTAGDEVMGVAPQAFAPFVCTDASLVTRKPAGLTLEQAATIPVAFLTASYALETLARIRKGDRVLIHAATGGVGLAAIQIARRAGAEIFATAGSEEKRGLLRSMGIAAVFDSRSLEFATAIRERTDGRGVDIVLNSLAGDALVASLDLVAPHGRFLEIGKSDIYQHRRLSLAPFQRAISFHSIDLDRMFRERQDEVQALLGDIGEAFVTGRYTPLPMRIFPMAEAEQAFRHMAQARHVGKVVLSPPERNGTRAAAARVQAPIVRPDAAYLITGGTGALGLHVAGWLADRGARHLVLAARREPAPAALAVIAALRTRGVAVHVAGGDVSNRADVERLVHLADPVPLAGVVHAAGVLSDGALATLTPERFTPVLAPKVDGAWHLHEATQALDLDWLVLFSSMASVTGSAGQANYAAANAALDTLAQYRRASGLPAVAINWGPWAGDGMAASEVVSARLMREGVRPLPPAEALARLDALLRADAPAQVMVASIGAERLAAALDRTSVVPEGAPTGSAPLTRDRLARTPADARVELLEAHIREQISRVSGIPVGRLDASASLGALGIDSLTSLELFTHLEDALQTPLPPSLITEELNIARLARFLADGIEVG